MVKGRGRTGAQRPLERLGHDAGANATAAPSRGTMTDDWATGSGIVNLSCDAGYHELALTPLSSNGARSRKDGIVGIDDLLIPESPLVALHRVLPALALFLGGIDEGVFVQDAARQIVFANDAGARLCGFASAADLLATPIGDVLHRFAVFDASGNPFALSQLPAQRVLAGESVPELALRWVIIATGEERWSAVKATPVRDAGGAVQFVVSVFRDITARRQAETQARFLTAASTLLAASLGYEATLQHVADLAVPAIADWCGVDILDETGVLVPIAGGHRDPEKIALALAVRRRYPPDPADPNGAAATLRTGKAVLVPEIPDALLAAAATDAEHLSLLRALGLHSLMVVPLIARGRGLGTLTLVSSDPARTYDADDLAFAEELGRRAAVAIDNARLYRESEIAEARYRGLFEGTADAVLLADASGNYVDANRALCDLLGYRREELVRMRSGSIAADGEWWRTQRERFVREGAWRGELLLRRKDGTTVAVEGRLTKVALSTGPLTLGTFRDITERRKAEEERQRFIAMVAHELRNPLASLQGYAQLMQRRERYDAKAVGTILDQAKRLERLTLDLRETVLLESGIPSLVRSPVDIRALILAAVEQVQTTTAAHTITVEMPSEVPQAQWDPDRIAQVLGNLLLNAIRYTPAGGVVHVRVEEGGDCVQVRVSDSGIGIPPEAIPRLFEPFYRATNAREGSARGMGLGLSISKAIVAAHGGELQVESVVGVGSTFTMIVPYAAPTL